MNKFPIPILLVVFNRKEIALASFEHIRRQRPKRLYIASDGARSDKIGEKEIVDDIRKTILDSIDWDCEVKTLFQSVNLGCGIGVFTAINWLFDNEKWGVIIEDDCICNDSFFKFMEEMLLRYEDDCRIGMVAGFNGVGSAHMQHSYTFSRYKACWGWATWRRAWRNMDMKMSWRGTEQERSILHNMGGNGRDIHYWQYRLRCIDENYVSAWDWQWYFSLAAQNQLCIFPSVSLVSNIGFGADATHTSIVGSNSFQKSAGKLTFPLSHPQKILPDTTFDRQFYKYNHTFYNFIIQLIPFGLKRKIKKTIMSIRCK